MARSGKVLRNRPAVDSTEATPPSEHSLTEREEQILRGIAAGMTTKEVADSMNIGQNTVRSIKSKLDVAARKELAGKLLSQRTSQGGDSGSEMPTGRHGNDNRIPRAIIERAVDVIGDRAEAFRWLGTPVRALGYRTPIAVAATTDGERSVLAVLDQLEHGVY